VGADQRHTTSTKEEDKISYCHKCLKSLYYLNKWAFKMNKYSFLSECFDISFTSTEKILIPKNFVGPLEIKSL
jgi:NMD protein affecting ribosome stability and mRNA decay